MSLTPEDRGVLLDALHRLEKPSLAARLATMAGKPAALLERALPAVASAVVARAAKLALDRALDIALHSLRHGPIGGGRKLHSALASASGAVGGAFGLSAVTIELPISTAIMLRAIAAIARAEGEDLDDPATALACLEVFALGGAPAAAGPADTGYFAVRTVLMRGVSEGAEILVGKSALKEGAPALIRFTAQIASRFGVVVSQKVAAQAVPIVGALGGAIVNLAFIEHFQDVARGHFAVRRLERTYGADVVRAEYEDLRASLRGPAAA